MITCYEIDENGEKSRIHVVDDSREDPECGDSYAHWLAERAAETFDREDEPDRIIEVDGACGRPVRYRVRRRPMCRYTAERIAEST